MTHPRAAGRPWRFAFVPILAFTACGGRVEEEDGPPASEESTGGGWFADGSSQGEPTSSGAQGSDQMTGHGSGGDGAQPAPGDLELGECSLGFSASLDARPCNWLADNRCYSSKEDACACVCPRDGPSVCSSGFYGGEGSQTRVFCH